MCESVIASIASQEIQYREMTFEDELRSKEGFGLAEHGMTLNERSAGTDPAEPTAPSGQSLGDPLPGLKPRAESSCPFGVEKNPLRNLKIAKFRRVPESPFG
jgi:hypothetical protein